MSVGAVSLVIGAAQFAFGRDLSGEMQDSQTLTRGTAEVSVNRAAKADRIASAAKPSSPTQTVSLRPAGLAETSVVIRLPLPTKASGTFFAPAATAKSGATLACEPVVSVLTEVAKRLQPGRCVT